jgi:hypothetical protein
MVLQLELYQTVYIVDHYSNLVDDEDSQVYIYAEMEALYFDILKREMRKYWCRPETPCYHTDPVEFMKHLSEAVKHEAERNLGVIPADRLHALTERVRSVWIDMESEIL